LQDLQRSINDGLALFRQVRFLNFLKHALERIYGAVNKIRALAAPLLGRNGAGILELLSLIFTLMYQQGDDHTVTVQSV